jgi:hypothetical protein
MAEDAHLESSKRAKKTKRDEKQLMFGFDEGRKEEG